MVKTLLFALNQLNHHLWKYPRKKTHSKFWAVFKSSVFAGQHVFPQIVTIFNILDIRPYKHQPKGYILCLKGQSPFNHQKITWIFSSCSQIFPTFDEGLRSLPALMNRPSAGFLEGWPHRVSKPCIFFQYVVLGHRLNNDANIYLSYPILSYLSVHVYTPRYFYCYYLYLYIYIYIYDLHMYMQMYMYMYMYM